MRFTKTIASASVAAVLGLAGVSVAGAVSNGSPATTGSPTTTATAPGNATTAPKVTAPKAAVRRLGRRAIVIAAKTIGIRPKDLAAGLRSGQTIAQIATDHGVQPQTVVDAIEQPAKAKIAAAEAAGKITADRAAKREQRLDKVVTAFVNDWHPKAKSGAKAPKHATTAPSTSTPTTAGASA